MRIPRILRFVSGGIFRRFPLLPCPAPPRLAGRFLQTADFFLSRAGKARRFCCRGKGPASYNTQRQQKGGKRAGAEGIGRRL